MRRDPETLHRRIADLLTERRHFVVATILEVKGSAPQRPGARMIVHPDSTFEFTIGGGTFEAEVIQDSLAAIHENAACLSRISFNEIGYRNVLSGSCSCDV